jgi:serine/threonine protein kinase
MLQKEKLNKGEMAKVKLEIKAMQALDHPNIVKLFDTKETKRMLFIMMEFCPRGDVLNYVQEKEKLSEQEATTFFRQLVYGMDHAHKQGYLHRDIKLENLMIAQDGSLKIGDWGFARNWSSDSLIKNEFPGSLHYASPEIVLAKPYTGPEVDVWSMGVTLYALASGCMPFFGHTDEHIVEKIKSSIFPTPPSFSKDLRDLLSHMLDENPITRYTIEQIKSHTLISCRVKINGVNRIRSRSFIAISHVPQLNLGEVKPEDTILTTTRNIIVTPKGIITHRRYFEVSPPSSNDSSPMSSTSSLTSSFDANSDLSSSSPLSSPFSSGNDFLPSGNSGSNPNAASPSKQRKNKLARLVNLLTRSLKNKSINEESKKTMKTLKPNTNNYQSAYI